MSARMVSIGPAAVPVVPISQFRRSRAIDMQAVWQIVGPAAEKNLDRLPLWQVIAAAYVEGLHHGAELAQEQKL